MFQGLPSGAAFASAHQGVIPLPWETMTVRSRWHGNVCTCSQAEQGDAGQCATGREICLHSNGGREGGPICCGRGYTAQTRETRMPCMAGSMDLTQQRQFCMNMTQRHKLHRPVRRASKHGYKCNSPYCTAVRATALGQISRTGHLCNQHLVWNGRYRLSRRAPLPGC